ncbi:MAG TPA: Ig-like domain-containing protein [Gemmatimonadales bacterium]|nr:Ig-like domain-containing protein [Gemmatimonadales bacterium]
MRRRAVLALLAVAACEAPFSIAPPVKNISIAPDSASLETGDTLHLSAAVTDSAGHPVSTPIYWSTSADSIAFVSTSGVVTTRLPGQVTIRASAGGLTDSVLIHVAPRITAVLIDQGDLLLPTGGAVSYTASTLDAQGDHLVGRPVTWTSQDPDIVTISPGGGATALQPGSTHVIASRGHVADTVSVMIGTLHFTALRAGPADHTCGLTDESVAFCWGANDLGQLGVPALSQSTTPLASPHNPLFTQLTAGATFSCGTSGSGTVYCWGSSARGRLGAGVNQLSTATPLVVADSFTVAGLASGWNHTCGFGMVGTICWGENPGAGGSGPITWNPHTIAGAPAFSVISASVGFGCGLSTDSTAYCWGVNDAGQLGNGGINETTMPEAVAGRLKFIQVATGFSHACGLRATGEVDCWGSSLYGQLGRGDTASHSTPVAVSGGIAFVTIAAGGRRTCGATSDGTGYCWGDSLFAPAAIPGTVKFASLTVGNAHACGLAADGRGYCWGRNIRGQLGDGTFSDRTSPTLVLGQP